MANSEPKPDATIAAPTLVEVFQNADGEQLAAIDAMIAQLKGEQQKIQQTIDGLAQIRKALDVKINGLPQRKPRGAQTPKAAKSPQVTAPAAAAAALKRIDDDEDDALLTRIHDYLSRQTEPKSLTVIATALGVDGRTIMHKVKHPWFLQTSLGFEIARS